jgi:hypothetical protein
MSQPAPDSPAAVVTALYRGILGREPDAGGLETYVRKIERGTSYEAIVRAMLKSEEFEARLQLLGLDQSSEENPAADGSEPFSAESCRPVCIAGVHRSGTSLVTNMLRQCGLYLGEPRELVRPAQDNMDGFWEHRLFSRVNERALAEMGGAWDSPPPAGAAEEFSAELKAHALKLAAGMEAHVPWGWKDPRNCLTMRLWRGLFPGMRVVIPLRHPLETAASLEARNHFPVSVGLALWAEYHRRVLDTVPRAGRIVTRYDAYFSNPEAELRRVLKFLGIAATDEVVAEACALVKKPMRHHRSSEEELARDGMPPGVADLYDQLCEEARKEVEPPDPPPASAPGKKTARPNRADWHFPKQSRAWMEALDAAECFIDPSEVLFAPHSFMEFYPRALPSLLLNETSLRENGWLIFHKGVDDRIAFPLAEVLKREFDPVFANKRFVILARKGLAVQAMDFNPEDVSSLWSNLEKLRSAADNAPLSARTGKCAAVISAYNRPWALARTLPQVARLGCPVLVVEDGSEPMHEAAYKKIRAEFPSVHWIAMPENRGIPCAMNTGISYWLADPDIEWISYFEEDVDVHPDLLRRLTVVQHRVERPLLTGRRPPEHPAAGEEEINGVRVLHFHSTSNQHFHAHRDYWSAVLPIPAPAPDFEGCKKTAYCDWWLASWAPESVCNTGRKIICVPGLVSAFATKAEDSSWGNESEPDEGLLKESQGNSTQSECH